MHNVLEPGSPGNCKYLLVGTNDALQHGARSAPIVTALCDTTVVCRDRNIFVAFRNRKYRPRKRNKSDQTQLMNGGKLNGKLWTSWKGRSFQISFSMWTLHEVWCNDFRSNEMKPAAGICFDEFCDCHKCFKSENFSMVSAGNLYFIFNKLQGFEPLTICHQAHQ